MWPVIRRSSIRASAPSSWRNAESWVHGSKARPISEIEARPMLQEPTSRGSEFLRQNEPLDVGADSAGAKARVRSGDSRHEPPPGARTAESARTHSLERAD